MMNMALSGNMVFGCFWIFLCMNIYEPTLLGLETAAKAAHMQQSRQATARKVENSNPTRMVLNCYCVIILGGSYTSMIMYLDQPLFLPKLGCLGNHCEPPPEAITLCRIVLWQKPGTLQVVMSPWSRHGHGLGNTGNHTRNMPRQCLGKGPILAG